MKPAPETDIPQQALGFRVQLYGLDKHHKLFTPRQLVALTTFSDLVREARQLALAHARGVFGDDDPRGVADRGTGATAYADAVATYLAFAVDRCADFWCSLCAWANQPKNELVTHVFGRQALSMVWDFAEANPFSESGGNYLGNLGFVAKVLDGLGQAALPGEVKQLNAIESVNGVKQPVICTDPPYYDNIGYADLSDFFYVWLRRSLCDVYPGMLKLIVTPKREELIADPHRFDGDRARAEQFFESNLGVVFTNMWKTHNPSFPLTLFYAFKQTEADDTEPVEDAQSDSTRGLRASTGWETMLAGLIRASFAIVGTWPMQTERSGRPRGTGSNALASSIVLVCRPRPADAKAATRREFLTALKKELPEALKQLQHGNIAPVDLAQAAIGPGMAAFSRYQQVVESDGKPMTIRTALQLINQALDEVLSDQDSEYDSHTRFALAWFEQYALSEGPFGDADVLARAKDCSISGLVEAGVLSSRAGKVRLLKRDELEEEWSPKPGRQPYVWEVTQHLIRALEKQGEEAAAGILRQVGSLGEIARDLAYRLYNTCEKKRWAEEARAYNSLVIAWPEVERLSRQQPSLPKQKSDATLLDDIEEE